MGIQRVDRTSAIEAKAGIRATSTQGAYEAGQFYVRKIAGKPIPADAEFHYVGIYEARGSNHTMDYQPVNIEVDRPGRKVVLVLSTYETVTWNILPKNGTQIAGVIYSGYKGAIVTGAPSDYLFGGYTGAVPYDYPSAAASSQIAMISSFLGRPTPATSFQANYTGSGFVIR